MKATSQGNANKNEIMTEIIETFSLSYRINPIEVNQQMGIGSLKKV